MTIEQAGSLGEVVGAIATLATLWYLALQIRANTRATRAEARRTTLNNRTAAMAELIANEDVARIFNDGLADPNALTQTERVRLEFLLSRLAADAALLAAERRDGFADDEWAEPGIAAIVELLKTPGGRAYWRRRRSDFVPVFQAHVDAALGAPGAGR